MILLREHEPKASFMPLTTPGKTDIFPCRLPAQVARVPNEFPAVVK